MRMILKYSVMRVGRIIRVSPFPFDVNKKLNSKILLYDGARIPVRIVCVCDGKDIRWVRRARTINIERLFCIHCIQKMHFSILYDYTIVVQLL